MDELRLYATSTFALELTVKNQLKDMGYEITSSSDGKVEINGNFKDIARLNLWLRSADRVFIKMGEFKALTFEELFEKTKEIPWENLITKDGKFTVNGKSVDSTLFSVRSCKSIVKKAIVERLKDKYKKEWFEETGPEYTVQISMLRDIATLSIDTSGKGLNKRGYREAPVVASLKETLGAGLVMLSYYNKERTLLDPLCGSGTIPIEAAMIAKNIAPGLNRDFACKHWPQIDKDIWKIAYQEAYDLIDRDIKLDITGSDIDEEAIKCCLKNAKNAGVEKDITFKVQALNDIWIDKQYGIVITNPPYGERIGDYPTLNRLYLDMDKIFKKKKGWSIYVITGDLKFSSFFKRHYDRERKLYNGNMQVRYLQFYGEKPQ
ncbi:MAG: RNA methyltransferase [Candidatus Muiribacterium halophilum]|uniref:RNA methyltransferase n=1 Tax=Muiribacterium halophilum TaxID=2053465 RepID=A0A2N5ZKR1_MUIH1|nr:MAG: RNA methyltransferase [Candidatus Muirbacterium halophilum]